MRKNCWAVQWKGKLASDDGKYGEPVRTALFRSRKHAQVWLEDNRYWSRLGAYVVRVRVSITEI